MSPTTRSAAAVASRSRPRSRSAPRCRWPGWRPPTWTTRRRPRTRARRTAATRTRSSPWTARRGTSCSGTPRRNCRTFSADLRGTMNVAADDAGLTARRSVVDAVTNVPAPVNEPVRQDQPGSQDRAVLESKIKELAGEQAELTMTIGGQRRMGGGEQVSVVQPHNHRHVLGRLGNATDADVAAAIDAAAQAAPAWRALSFDDRAAILLKAADLLAGPWRATVNAATILGQSKSPFQAEIDAACELIDFWRFNVHYARRLLAEQPA